MKDNIIFKMNLVSHLAAADCASGVAGHIDISKHTFTIIYHQQDPDNKDVLEVTIPKTARYFLSKILHQKIDDNISFQLNLGIRLAAAVCGSGNHINLNIAKHTETVISHNISQIQDMSLV